MPLQSARHARFAQLDVQIPELEQRLCNLRRERNSLTMLGSIAPDIIILICEHILEGSDPGDLSDFVSFTHIFYYVYHVAIHTSSLWTSLNSKHSDGWRRMSFSRSNGHPLHLTWDDQDDSANDGELYAHEFFRPSTSDSNANNRDDACEIFHASVSAMLKISKEDYWNVTQVPRFLLGPAPQLRYLEIGSYGDRTLIMDFKLLGGDLQSLCSLTLDGVDLSQYDSDSVFSTWHCPSMREFVLRRVRGHRSDFHYLIRAMPLLEVLRIKRCYMRHSERECTPAGVPFSSSLQLPHLHTIHMEDFDRDEAVVYLSPLPNPTKHFLISIWDRNRYYTDVAMNRLITSRLVEFWDTVSGHGSRALLSLKAIIKSANPELHEDFPDSMLVAGAPDHPEPCFYHSDSPSLSWSANCRLECESASLIPMVSTLEYNFEDRYVGIRLMGRWAVHQFPNVQHIIISGWITIICITEDDKAELVAYVSKRVLEGNPVKKVTFKGIREPITEFEERLKAAAGDSLEVTWPTVEEED
jgi:hypothetical protein